MGGGLVSNANGVAHLHNKKIRILGNKNGIHIVTRVIQTIFSACSVRRQHHCDIEGTPHLAGVDGYSLVRGDGLVPVLPFDPDVCKGNIRKEGILQHTRIYE